MTVANGRALLAIPGPTNIPDRVLQAMIRPAEEIYSGPMVALTDGLLGDLQRIFRTRARTYIYAANGHGGWEAAVSNVLSRGDKVLVVFGAPAGSGGKTAGAPRDTCSPGASYAPRLSMKAGRGCGNSCITITVGNEASSRARWRSNSARSRQVCCKAADAPSST